MVMDKGLLSEVPIWHLNDNVNVTENVRSLEIYGVKARHIKI